MLGDIALDVTQPKAALEAYQKTLETQLKLGDPNSPERANIYDSIACASCNVLLCPNPALVA
jgi:hypothetical protein